MVIKSWQDQDALEQLAEIQRNGEVIEGVIRSIKPMKLPVLVDGKSVSKETTALLVALPGGVTGYCPAEEFRERVFRSYNQYVSRKESFVITRIDLDNNMALLSANKAAEIERGEFWDTITELVEQGTLEETEFEATINGRNPKNGNIHLRISGQDAYMFSNEWSWRSREIIDPQQGEVIKVKVVLFDKELGQVRVSRRLALPDPRDYLKTLNTNDIIAGRIESIHPIHGLYIEVENNVVLKGSRIKSLEKPEVGDYVSCRVQRIDTEKREGRVLILGYPRGKRKKKDIGSFLFE